jgi:drug/metabolite transporter (DMT)-like permease
VDAGRTAKGLMLAAGSGVLYGSINVLAKPLDIHPFLKGAIAYLVSATVLSPFLMRLRIQRRDWPKVLAMGLVGGGLAPALLFFGLRETAAADTGLLLTAELVATAALAFLFLGERFRPREAAGLLCLLAAAVLVALASRTGGTGASTFRGVLLVLGAAVCWGVDNAVSARLVGAYAAPGLIAVKGLLGGLASLAAALVVRPALPSLPDAVAMAGLGVVSIAVSSLLFYFALGAVGAARTSAMNVATTALVGAFGGALVLGEYLHALHAAALALVLGGASLLARPGPRAASVPS